MSSKRIGLAIDSLAGGGAEKIVLTLATELKRLGHEPHLLVLTPHYDYAVPEEIPLHVCFDEGERHIIAWWRLGRSVARVKQWFDELEQTYGGFDLILSNLDKSNLLLTRAGVSPLYIVVHNSIEEELKRERKLGLLAYLAMLRTKLALNGQALITVSKGIAQEIRQSGRISPRSMRTIYNPFDIEAIRAKAAEEHPDIPKGDYLIHVGRVARQKRHDILFQALAKMHKPLPLVLLCNNPKKAMKLARKYGVADRIICPGFQANPFPWIKAARLLVLSSDYEGFGNVLVEGLLCGTPVISTDCPHGPDEILTGELAKYLVPRRDSKALSQKLEQALEYYPPFADSQILTQVTIDKIVADYLSLCESS
ncbi:glycosyl transferase [Shewanella algae]|jgi:glycosyltransferase involved in cell wall biosynthesis|uniref:Glycosyltransferase involved in cell wall biosynthesis n=1 Tax=Shewanella chilikensis TaxID=558541 RepID=A0ABX5PQU8_9GAMM|nr:MULTISPECIES: glycosyltransferase [Shewanella]AXQ14177.1 glycosyl transferase [Shewanella algae]MBO2626540.1 glycosyltransferase [Shewanella algae]MBZ4678523.1 glycosyl transferase [Shewanella sp.]MCA0950370.1 glycosyltransferase [Shewanella chilikensis]MCE9851235.1 glycosyltransferase [Shewanella chilikensis]